MDSMAPSSKIDDTLKDAAETIRKDLAAAYRLVAHMGMDDSIFTHISARLPGDDEHFLLNPYGYRFDEVTASNLVTVSHEGVVIDDPVGHGINQAGFTIHSAVHSARPDVACVLHTHTVAGVAVSCLEEGLLSLNQWAMEFHGRVAYHDYEGIALSLDERQRLVADLGDRPVMILRNHGLLVCGRTVGEAFRRMFNLERSCQAQLAIMATGASIVRPNEALCEFTARQYEHWEAQHEAGGVDPEWMAFLRQAKKVAPGFDQ